MSYEKELTRIASADKRIVIMTAENRAPVRNIPDLLPDRFIDTGITEQCMLGAAAGLALAGRIPIVHALSTFLVLRVYEFIRSDIGIAKLPVKMVGFIPGILSDGNGPTHQGVDDISVLRSIPGVRIFCPKDSEELSDGLESLIYDPFPWYIRYVGNDSTRHELIKNGESIIGSTSSITYGSDVIILSYGYLTNECLLAARLLKEQGVGATLIQFLTLQPIDEDRLKLAATSGKRIYIVEDHFRIGGLYTIFAEYCLRNRFSPSVTSISLGDSWFKAGNLNKVMENCGFTGELIAARIMKQS